MVHLILESLVLPKTILLILQFEVLFYPARGTSSLYPETEVLLDEIFEPNETKFQHNVSYSPSDLVGQILCE
jgi:hypothetical protein